MATTNEKWSKITHFLQFLQFTVIEFLPKRHTLDDEVLASALLDRLLYICLLHLFSFKFPSFPLCALRGFVGVSKGISGEYALANSFFVVGAYIFCL